jgi:hypothetical protein
MVRWQLGGLGGTEQLAASAHCGCRNAAVNLLAPLILPATWARVSKQAVVQHAHKGPTKPPCQLPAPIRFAQAFRTKTRLRQSSKRECRIKTVRIEVEL